MASPPRPGSSGVNVPGFVVYATFRIGDWSIFWTTAEPSTTLPDLSAIGFEYPRGEKGTWSVTGYGPASTSEDFIAVELRANNTTGGVEFDKVESPTAAFKMAP